MTRSSSHTQPSLQGHRQGHLTPQVLQGLCPGEVPALPGLSLVARRFQIVPAFICGFLLSQETGPLGRDKPVSAESAHTLPTAGDSATAGSLELSWVRARPHELCPAGSAPGSQDLSAHSGGQRGLPAGPQGHSELPGRPHRHQQRQAHTLPAAHLPPRAEKESHGTWGSRGPYAAPPKPVSGCLQEPAGPASPASTWHAAARPLALSAHPAQRNFSRPGTLSP